MKVRSIEPADVSAIVMHRSRRQQILARRQMDEDAASLEHMSEPQPHAVGRIERQQIFAGEGDLALGHLAALGP